MLIQAKLTFKTDEEADLISACYDTIGTLNFIGGCYGLPHINSTYVEELNHTTVFNLEIECTKDEIQNIKNQLASISLSDLEDTADDKTMG